MASFNAPMSVRSVTSKMPATLRRRFHGSVANSSQATPGTSASTSTSTSNSSDHTCLERCSFEAGCKKSEVGA